MAQPRYFGSGSCLRFQIHVRNFTGFPGIVIRHGISDEVTGPNIPKKYRATPNNPDCKSHLFQSKLRSPLIPEVVGTIFFFVFREILDSLFE